MDETKTVFWPGFVLFSKADDSIPKWIVLHIVAGPSSELGVGDTWKFPREWARGHGIPANLANPGQGGMTAGGDSLGTLSRQSGGWTTSATCSASWVKSSSRNCAECAPRMPGNRTTSQTAPWSSSPDRAEDRRDGRARSTTRRTDPRGKRGSASSAPKRSPGSRCQRCAATPTRDRLCACRGMLSMQLLALAYGVRGCP